MKDAVEIADPVEEAVCAPQPAKASGWMGGVGKVLSNRTIGLLVVNVAFILLLSRLSKYFLTGENFTVIINNMALESIALAGLTMVLAAGLFDLSVDGIVDMSGVIVGKLLNLGVGVVPAMAAAMGAALLVGLINGTFINKLRMNPLMTTLATWWITVGIGLGITRAISPFGFPKVFQDIGQIRIFGIKIFVYYAIIILAFFAIMLAKTRFGYHVYAMGGNRRAALLHGINVDRLGIILYVILGGLSGFIGIVMAARLNAGTPNAVDGMALRVIAGATIGGCALGGGRGSIVGGLLGLLLMNMLSNATTLLGVSPWWQKAIIGSVLFIAVTLDAIRGRKTGGVGLGI